MQGQHPTYARRLLEEGIIVAAIVDGRIVNTMHCYCRSARHADIGANTLPGFRRKGFAVASGSMLCTLLHERGLTPTWSTVSENSASQTLAAALGFVSFSRRVYLTPGDPL